MQYISVATQWAIYQVKDETFLMLQNGMKDSPPHVVLELMVFAGEAKLMGTVGTMSMSAGGDDEEDEDGLPEDGSPFDEDLDGDDE